MSEQTSQKGSHFRVVVAISGWLAAAAMGLLNLPAQINSFRKEWPTAAESVGLWTPVDSRYEGDWSLVNNCEDDPFEVGNLAEEKQIDSGKSSPLGSDLDLVIRFSGTTVSGEVSSRGLARNYAYGEAMMIGAVFFSGTRLRVFDWINGKPVTLANIKLSEAADGCLALTTTNQVGRYFHERALLVRQPKGYYDKLDKDQGILQQTIIKASRDRNIKPSSRSNQ